jgi:hypothetical protein
MGRGRNILPAATLVSARDTRPDVLGGVTHGRGADAALTRHAWPLGHGQGIPHAISLPLRPALGRHRPRATSEYDALGQSYPRSGVAAGHSRRDPA